MDITAGDVVRSFPTEVWGNRRLDLVDTLVHPEYRADDSFAGRGFVRRNVTRFYIRFPDLSIEILQLIEEGGRVDVLFTYSGTHQGMFGGIKPTGRFIRSNEACFFRVEGGQVAEGDFVVDGLGARIQLGVLPADFWTNPRR